MTENSRVRVGILHSLSGTLAISESALKDAELMAIAEINQAGGILGHQIEPVVEDSASDPTVFVNKAEKLLQVDQAVTLFGGWSSTGRKLLLPCLEAHDALLWYPVQYEGLECSQQIFYTGACPNQQVEPAVNWLLQQQRRRFYLLGMDYVFPRVVNKIVKAQLHNGGGCVVGETYPALGSQDFQAIIADIQHAKPDVVFSTLNGDSNVAFYQQYQATGITAADIPIMAISASEMELCCIGEAAIGHYATWNYFQSIDTPENYTFVNHFRARYGTDRVTSDPIQSAYSQVYLWKQAVEAAQSFESDRVRAAAHGQTLNAPGGWVRVEQNQHLWKEVYIGQIASSGQFQIIFKGDRPIKPQPWMGVEDANFERSGLIIDLLAEVSGAIQSNCQLERQSQELQGTMAELVETNQQLQQTQTQLQEMTHREDLFKRRLSSQIRNSLELNTILRTAVHEIRNLLEIDRCRFVWCRTEAEALHFQQTHAVYQAGSSDAAQADSLTAVEVLGNKILTESFLQLDQITTDSRLDEATRSTLATVDVKSLLAIAIITHAHQTGIIICEHCSHVRPWHTHEVELLRDVADQLAIAIDQAGLYEQSRTATLAAQAQAQQLEQTLRQLQQTQSQLVQTEKMSGLGQLVAGVAHEINNPVNFIYGNLGYADEYVANLLELVQLYQQRYAEPIPDIQTHLETIDFAFLAEDLPRMLSSMRMGAERIRQIVLSLRNFSRLDEADMKPVNIHEGIDSTLLILQHRLKRKLGSSEVRVIKKYGDLPLVECYAGQLNQVFMNILSNALDAIEEAQAERAQPSSQSSSLEPPYEIQIQTEVVEEQQVRISITDNGPGMTPSVQEQLFNPFFTTKPIGKGTGMGMAISYQIITEKHGGSLFCQSSPGQGATFIIEIPLGQTD